MIKNVHAFQFDELLFKNLTERLVEIFLKLRSIAT
jgi:hypothetical protein